MGGRETGGIPRECCKERAANTARQVGEGGDRNPKTLLGGSDNFYFDSKTTLHPGHRPHAQANEVVSGQEG
jgi:hypothetical protein